MPQKPEVQIDRSAEEWHLRFEQQAGWTSKARSYLLQKTRTRWRGRILEVGCGTGAITRRLNSETPVQTRVYGLDIDRDFLRLAKIKDTKTRFCAGNGIALPYASGIFDAAVCHFFLLWIPRPEQALAEMVRVTRSGGQVMAFAEPDYGGRIDAPAELEALGRLQAEALRLQGSAPNRGRELAQLFHAVGLEEVESGVLGGQWRKQSRGAWEIEAEWQVLEKDLGRMLPAEELLHLKEVNASAWENGSRVLYVPTFYAVGSVAKTNLNH